MRDEEAAGAEYPDLLEDLTQAIMGGGKRETHQGGLDFASKPTLSEENLAVRVEWEMRRRGWSQERLAKEMADAGCPLHQSAISKIINPRTDGKRRAISVDEAIAFSKVFGLPLHELPMPLEVAQSQELHLVIQELDKLQDQMASIFDKEQIAWFRFSDLVKDETVLEGYIQWLNVTKKIGPEEARNMLLQWLDRAITRDRYLTGLIFTPSSEKHGLTELTSGIAGMSVASLVKTYVFVKTIQTETRESIEHSLPSFAHHLIKSGFAEAVAPLINKQMDGRGVRNDDVLDVLDAVKSRLDEIASMTPLTGDEEVEKLAAAIAIPYFERGMSEQSLAKASGKSHREILDALKRAGILY